MNVVHRDCTIVDPKSAADELKQMAATNDP
jgi:hypothetical protein